MRPLKNVAASRKVSLVFRKASGLGIKPQNPGILVLLFSVTALAACSATPSTHAASPTTTTKAAPTTTTTAPSSTTSSVVQSGNAPPPQIYGDLEQRAIPYATLDGQPLLLDVFLPAPANGNTPPATVPAVIDIHGGGFVKGSRTGQDPISAKIAQAGIAAFSIDYTVATPTQAGFPLQIQQVLAAVSFVRTNAARFGIDPNEIGLFGTSAGATLAVLSAMAAPQLQPDAKVQADVGWSGGYDLTAALNGSAKVDALNQISNVMEFLGCTSTSDPTCPEKATKASAIDYVSKASPPTLLATSDDFKVGCEIVDPGQSSAMAQALATKGVSVRLDVNHSCAHALAYASIELGPTVAFLSQYLSSSK